MKVKLKKAIANEFWFEACMIEYAIIEDRTSSILFHSGVCEKAYDSSKKLSNKLNSIEHQIGKEHFVISKKIDKQLIVDIRNWKDKRNDIVHRACTLEYNNMDIIEVAKTGDELVKQLDNASRGVTNLANKLYGNKK